MKTLYVLAPNKKEADKFMEHWTPEGWLESIPFGGCFSSIPKALAKKKKALTLFENHMKNLHTLEGEAVRKMYEDKGLTGWGSWKADKIQKEKFDKINLYQVFEYSVPTLGNAFKRTEP